MTCRYPVYIRIIKKTYSLALFIIALISISTETQPLKAQSIINKPPNGWHLLDLENDGYYGISLSRGGETFLQNKQAKPVIVAIIDAGADTLHPALNDRLWRNSGEIFNNRKDDDGNGYVDDFFGWNFLGNGLDTNLNVKTDLYEYQRIYLQNRDAFENLTKVDRLKGRKKENYDRWLRAKRKTIEASPAYKASNKMRELKDLMGPADSIIRERVRSVYTGIDLDTLQFDTLDRSLLAAVSMMQFVYSIVEPETNNTVLTKKLDSLINNYNVTDDVALAYTDTLTDYRKKVLGLRRNKGYGNNRVMVGNTMHGTHVAGIIGEITGINESIAKSVSLMILRAVPDGDEHDIDIASAIRYAVDNGATIINMSFGKAFSPEEKLVQKAVRYAARKEVLLVQAAGNDNLDIDTAYNYPTAKYKGRKASNYITVGASSDPKFSESKFLIAPFSNYGKEIVDVFAPGVSIYSAVPDGAYASLSGTSMAAPVVSGLAALLKAVYPELKATELKKLIEDSALKHSESTPMPRKEGNISLKDVSRTGGIINVYEALKMAEDRS